MVIPFYGGRTPMTMSASGISGQRIEDPRQNSMAMARGFFNGVPQQQRNFSALNYAPIDEKSYSAIYGNSSDPRFRNLSALTIPSKRQPQIGVANNRTGIMPSSNRQAPIGVSNNRMGAGTPSTPSKDKKKYKLGEGLLSFVDSPFGGGVASGLLQASGYSPRPVGFGEALGMAMEKGQQAEMQANTLAFQREQFAETQSQNQAANFLANKKLDIEIEKLLQPQLSAFTKSLIQADIDPSSPEGLKMLENYYKKASTSITLDNKGEGEYSKNRGEYFAKEIGDINDKSKVAQNNLIQYEAIESLLPNFKIGAFSETLVGLNNVAKRFGLPDIVEGTGSAEAMRSFMGNLTMNTLTNFTGAISDGERAFAQSINPNLSMSEDGIRMLMKINRKIFENQIVKNDEALKWEEKYGSLMARNEKGQGWGMYWNKYTNDNPVFTDKFKEEINNVSGTVDDSFKDQIMDLDLDGDGVMDKVFQYDGKYYKLEPEEVKK